MQLNEVLAQFGLQNKEDDVYLALLELGQAGVFEISVKASIKRTTTYDVLENLKRKGLVGQTIKGNKRLFYAEEPETLNKLLEDKKNKLNEIMPLLKSLCNTAGTKPRIRYYEGKTGLKEVYKDTLNYNTEIMAFVSENISKKLGTFSDEYIKKRIEKKIYARVIASANDFMKNYKNKDKEYLKKTRLVPKEQFPFSIEMNIYGNKVGYISFQEEIAIIIESNEISNNMKLLFELAWKGAKKTT
ncbi:hypothetical protein KAI92_00400 [Candidatus Parcubacteria bacterium]|nr:hypothetical protein [Candidatus Parcubacteria bacterium]